ncbi:myb family transcription factor EFM-like [Olea europaea subsp. europaea]|uniref:Myb family transcription factor EFM-like n=1 Tax=Olea europaea subsp. europaea TaxID=158383 RepID=A0A8S0RAE1_OLEEU|nr:myb family transcription factor EFM-like [Olea europaea subsp. europaea]
MAALISGNSGLLPGNQFSRSLLNWTLKIWQEMGPSELSLTCRQSEMKPYIPRTISEFLEEVSLINNSSERLSKLDDCVNKLQDEMKKIDAFKRELPLCKKDEEGNNRPVNLMDELLQSSNNRTVGRVFMPFKGYTNFPMMTVRKEDRDELPRAAGLSLCMPGIKNVVDLVRKTVPLALLPEDDPSKYELKKLKEKKEEIDVLALGRNFLKAQLVWKIADKKIKEADGWFYSLLSLWFFLKNV